MINQNELQTKNFKQLFENYGIFSEKIQTKVVELFPENFIPLSNAHMVLKWEKIYNLLFYKFKNTYSSYNDEETNDNLIIALSHLLPQLWVQTVRLGDDFLSQLNADGLYTNETSVSNNSSGNQSSTSDTTTGSNQTNSSKIVDPENTFIEVESVSGSTPNEGAHGDFSDIQDISNVSQTKTKNTQETVATTSSNDTYSGNDVSNNTSNSNSVSSFKDVGLFDSLGFETFSSVINDFLNARILQNIFSTKVSNIDVRYVIGDDSLYKKTSNLNLQGGVLNAPVNPSDLVSKAYLEAHTPHVPTNLHSQFVLRTTEDEGFGENQQIINIEKENKINENLANIDNLKLQASNLNTSGRVANTPSEDTDIATKKYVDDSRVESSIDVARTIETEGPGTDQSLININKETRISSNTTLVLGLVDNLNNLGQNVQTNTNNLSTITSHVNLNTNKTVDLDENGRVNGTPLHDNSLVNKEYVDDSKETLENKTMDLNTSGQTSPKTLISNDNSIANVAFVKENFVEITDDIFTYVDFYNQASKTEILFGSLDHLDGNAFSISQENIDITSRNKTFDFIVEFEVDQTSTIVPDDEEMYVAYQLEITGPRAEELFDKEWIVNDLTAIFQNDLSQIINQFAVIKSNQDNRFFVKIFAKINGLTYGYFKNNFEKLKKIKANIGVI